MRLPALAAADAPRRAVTWAAVPALLAGALALHWAAFGARPVFPFLFFFPAAILATLAGGLRHGALLALAAGVLCWATGLHPAGHLWPDAQQGIGIGAFLAGTGLAISLVDALRRDRARLRRQQARHQHLLDAQRTMYHELQHRVANNLQFVCSLLTLESRHAGGADPGAVLEEAARRLTLLARLHRRLHDPAATTEGFGELMEEIGRDLLEATGTRNVVLRVEAAPLALDPDRLTWLSLIVTELLTNALKHAFADGRPGTVSVALRRQDAARCMLEVRDDGPGLPAGSDPRRADSLGMQIIRSLVRRLDGTLSVRSEGGLVTRIEFPA